MIGELNGNINYIRSLDYQFTIEELKKAIKLMGTEPLAFYSSKLKENFLSFNKLPESMVSPNGDGNLVFCLASMFLIFRYARRIIVYRIQNMVISWNFYLRRNCRMIHNLSQKFQQIFGYSKKNNQLPYSL